MTGWRLVKRVAPLSQSCNWRTSGIGVSAFYLSKLDAARAALVKTPSAERALAYLKLLVPCVAYLDRRRHACELKRLLYFRWAEDDAGHTLRCVRGEIVMTCAVVWKCKIQDAQGKEERGDLSFVSRLILYIALPQLWLWRTRSEGAALPMLCSEKCQRAALATCLLRIQAIAIREWEKEAFRLDVHLKAHKSSSLGAKMCKWAAVIARELRPYDGPAFSAMAQEYEALFLFFIPAETVEQRHALLVDARKRFESLGHVDRVKQIATIAIPLERQESLPHAEVNRIVRAVPAVSAAATYEALKKPLVTERFDENTRALAVGRTQDQTHSQPTVSGDSSSSSSEPLPAGGTGAAVTR